MEWSESAPAVYLCLSNCQALRLPMRITLTVSSILMPHLPPADVPLDGLAAELTDICKPTDSSRNLRRPLD